MECIYCDSDRLMKNGKTVDGAQQFKCKDCGRYFREGQDPTEKKTITNQRKPKMGLSEDQLRAKHDVKYQVKQAVKTLTEDVYLSTPEFIQHAKIKLGQGYRAVIDHPDFETYHGRTGSTVYWSHQDSIKKLKSEGVLQ